MISYCPPKNHASCDEKNYTIASTFEKAKTLRFELLFGAWDKKARKNDNDDVTKAIDYYFLPHEIFGFACRSEGGICQRFQYAFVLRACQPGEVGNIVTGIFPGAEVVLVTSTGTSVLKFLAIINALKKSGVDPAQVSPLHYRRLNYLLEAKLNTDYLIGEIINEKNSA